MSNELIEVGVFWDVSEAHIAKAILEENEIRAFLDNENSFVVAPHHTQSSGMKLLVKQSDAARAEELLQTISED